MPLALEKHAHRQPPAEEGMIGVYTLVEYDHYLTGTFHPASPNQRGSMCAVLLASRAIDASS